MPTFTTELKDRKSGAIKLTEYEAWDMWQAGFQFVEFNPPTDEYRLRAPYRMLLNLDRGVLVIEQK